MATNLTSAAGLPPGWKREESLKQSGLSSGKTEVYYVSPGGRKLKNRMELQRALGDRYDLTNFDWRTGRFMPYARQQQHQHQHHQHQSLASSGVGGAAAGRIKTPADMLSSAAAAAAAAAALAAGASSSGQRSAAGAAAGSSGSAASASARSAVDPSLRLPVRQTASMLKQSVELVRGHPDSRRNDLQHGPKERPRQLFYHKRFDGLRACNPDTGEPRPEVGLPKHLQPAGGGPVTGSDQLVLNIADCLSSVGGGTSAAMAVVGQQNCKAFEKNPHVSVNPDQPLVRYHLVTDDEVRQQEAVVREARRRLAMALRLFKAGREASAA